MQRLVPFLAAVSAAALLVSFSACGHSPADGEAIDEVCVKDNHKKIKSVSGYLKMYSGMSFCERRGCPFALSPTEGPTPDGDMKVKVFFHRGAKPNKVEIKKMDNPGNEDLIFRDDKEQTFYTGSVVRLTGRVTVLPTKKGGAVCRMDSLKQVELIEPDA